MGYGRKDPQTIRIEATTDAGLKQKVDGLESQLAETAQEVETVKTNKADKTYVDSEIAKKASGAPDETFATLTDLQTAYPTGNSKNKLVAADGHIYNWDGTSWLDTGILYQAVGIANNSVVLNTLNNDVMGFTGDEITSNPNSGTSNGCGIQLIFDVRDLNTTGLVAKLMTKTFTNDEIITGFDLRLYGSSSKTSLGTTHGASPIFNIENGKTFDIQHDFTLSGDFDYLHGFVWVYATDYTKLLRFFQEKLTLNINGTVRLPSEYGNLSANACNWIFKEANHLPKQLINKTSFDDGTKEIIEKNTASFNGYHIKAIQNTNSTNLIQVAMNFDLSSIVGTAQANIDSFTFAFNLDIPEFEKVKEVRVQYRINNETVPGTTGGVTGGNRLDVRGQMKMDSPLIEYRRTDILTAVDNFIQAYIEVVLTEPLTEPIDIWLNGLGMVVKDTVVPLYGIKLYWANSSDVFESVENLDKKIITLKDLTIVRDNPLYNLKWNVLGDSITDNTHADASVKYHDIIKEKYGLQLVRNYGISGTKIANDGVNTTDYMALRYTSMDNDADLITVFAGTNDCGGAIPIGTMDDRVNTTFYGACHILFSGLIDKYPNKKIAVFTPLQSNYANRDTELEPYVDVIREVTAYYSIPCLDLYRGGGISAKNQSQVDLLMPDGLHPNNEGHQVIADKIAAFLMSV